MQKSQKEVPNTKAQGEEEEARGGENYLGLGLGLQYPNELTRA